jgi:hypothetical protein
LASGIALEISFGLQVQPSGQPDPFIGAATQAVEALTETGLFGTYLVDFLLIRECSQPINYITETHFRVQPVKYVPSWFPFATFKRQANHWRKSSDIAANVPFTLLKNGMVRRLQIAVSRIHPLPGCERLRAIYWV